VTFERVHTVWDYYDGSREGLADFNGKPHHYQSQWDEGADDWSPFFALTPVDSETLHLAMQQRTLWCTWEQAFHAAQVAQDSHPGYGVKNTRHDELEAILEARLPGEVSVTYTVRTQFYAIDGRPRRLLVSCAISKSSGARHLTNRWSACARNKRVFRLSCGRRCRVPQPGLRPQAGAREKEGHLSGGSARAPASSQRHVGA